MMRILRWGILKAAFLFMPLVTIADTYVAQVTDFVPPNPVDGAVVTWNGAGGDSVSDLVFGTSAFTSIQEATDAASAGSIVNIAKGIFEEGTEITVEKSIAFQGAGEGGTMITGATLHRVFRIAEGEFEVLFQDLTVTEGKPVSSAAGKNGGGILSDSTSRITLSRCTFSKNSALFLDLFSGGRGGGIHAAGDLLIQNSTLSGNLADIGGGGIFCDGNVRVEGSVFSSNGVEFGGGGGISCSGEVVIVASTFSLNTVADAGGGVLANEKITATGSHFSDNDAFWAGGGLASHSGDEIKVKDCSFVDNHAFDGGGGGIYYGAIGTLLVADSIFSGNRMIERGVGGAIRNKQAAAIITGSTFDSNPSVVQFGSVGSFGGAFYNGSGNALIANSTISGNAVGSFGMGGGVYNDSGHLAVSNCTITNNSTGFMGGTGGIHNEAGTVTVTNSIVAGNMGPTPDVTGGGYVSNGANFIGIDHTADAIFTAAGDKTFASTEATVIEDVLLPLEIHDEQTKIHRLSTGSPAINMGSDGDIPADFSDADGDADIVEPTPYDQRGPNYPRISGSSVDVGSFEAQELGTPEISLEVTDVAYTGDAYTGATVTISGGIGNLDPPGAVLEFFSASSASPESAIDPPINVGTYWVRAFFAGNMENHPVLTAVQSFRIEPVALTASATAADKVYDGNTDTTVTMTLSGVIGDDDVAASATGAFEDRDAGSNKVVLMSDITLTGADVVNYVLVPITSTTATISAADLTASATATSKIYDGTTAASVAIFLQGVIGDDSVAGLANGAFIDKNVGTDKIVEINSVSLTGSGAGNYAIGAVPSATSSIFATPLGVKALAADKVYDGTTMATVSVVLSGIIGEDDVIASASGTFADKNIGSDKIVSIIDFKVTGKDAANYSEGAVSNVNASITVASLVATAVAADKIYDGTSQAEISISLAGIVDGDVVNGTASGTFFDQSVGVAKSVSIGPVALSGTDAANYQVEQSGTAMADITPASLTVTAIADAKIFGSEDPPLSFEANGFVGDDTLESSVTGNLARQPGEGIGVYEILIGNLTANHGNYDISFTSASFEITAEPVTQSLSLGIGSANGGIILQLKGSTGMSCLIQYVDQLEGDWTNLTESLTIGPDGYLEIEDRLDSNFHSRFYRGIELE